MYIMEKFIHLLLLQNQHLSQHYKAIAQIKYHLLKKGNTLVGCLYIQLGAAFSLLVKRCTQLGKLYTQLGKLSPCPSSPEEHRGKSIPN